MDLVKCLDHAAGDNWALYHGDCCEVVRQLPSDSVGLTVYSPPFANVYTYSDSPRDMGNCGDMGEFSEHYRFLVGEIYRVTKPGRIVAVHCKELVKYSGSSEDGMAGMRDFPGELVRLHTEAGFGYASRITIWRSPVTEQRKTNRNALLYKTLRNDSSYSGQGFAEYILIFRRWAHTEAEKALVEPIQHTHEGFPLNRWQHHASPVWMDYRQALRSLDSRAASEALEQMDLDAINPGEIDQTDVLNVRIARDSQDEKHMCPLPLEIIRRCCGLWSNPGDVVLSPFAGIGSEGFAALRMGRKFVGVELKESYYKEAVRNLYGSTRQMGLAL